jgi:hypothetical protein
MADQVQLRLSFRLRWWVVPLIYLAMFNACIGIPVDVRRIAHIIGRHGIKIKVE